MSIGPLLVLARIFFIIHICSLISPYPGSKCFNYSKIFHSKTLCSPKNPLLSFTFHTKSCQYHHQPATTTTLLLFSRVKHKVAKLEFNSFLLLSSLLLLLLFMKFMT